MGNPAEMFEPLLDEERGAALAVTRPSPTLDGWDAVFPVPDDAPRIIPPHRLGKPSGKWVYRNEIAELLFVVCRFDKGGGDKEVLPLTFCQDTQGSREWRWRGYPPPRPLYGLERLSGSPDAPVLVVEGEKTADAAQELFPDYVAITSPGGSKAADKADWSPLRGRRAVIWPDNDNPGTDYEEDVARLINEVGASSTTVVSIPEGFLKRWDVADVLPEGWDVERLRGLLDDALPWEPPKEVKSESTIETPKVESELTELAALSPVEYDLVREAKAKELGIRTSTLDTEVKKRRSREQDGQGSEIVLSEPEPWPEQVDGHELLEGLMDAFRRYLVLPSGGVEVLTLWTVHAHAFEAFQHTPRLDIRSPEKGCGKTIVLDVLEALTPRSVRTENVTTAVLFRLVDAHRPTLLVDEVDTFLKNNEDLRGALNAGHRRGGQHLRCEGDKNELRGFKTFAPVAMAGIGRLPGTLLDRSIPISMKRRSADEQIEFFRRDRTDNLKVLSQKAARWTDDNQLALTEADPDIPEWLLNRAADNWRPLLAIADCVGGDWPALTRKISKETIEEDSSHRTQLLFDIKGIFEDQAVDRITSADICAALGKMEDRPWPEWGRSGKPITTRALAKQLSGFEIKPTLFRPNGLEKPARGYLLDDFADAFSRYSQSLIVTPLQPKETRAYSDNLSVTTNDDVTDRNPLKPAENGQCNDVTDGNSDIEGKWGTEI